MKYPFDKKVTSPINANGLAFVWRLFAFAAHEFWPLAASAFLSALDVAMALLPPILIARLIDDVLLGSGPSRRPLAIALAGAMAAASLARAAFGVADGTLAARAGARIVARLRERLHVALLRMDCAAFAARSPGEYVQRLLFDTETLQRFLVDTASRATVQILMAVGTCTALFLMNARLALVALVPIPALFFLGLRFKAKSAPAMAAYSSDVAAIDTALSETLTGFLEIRRANCWEWCAKRFHSPVWTAARRRGDLERLLLGFGSASSAATALAIAGVWLMAGLSATGHQPFGTGFVLAFLGYQAMLYGPIGFMAQLYGEFVDALVAARRIFEILDTSSEQTGGLEVPQRITRLVLQEVSFAYPGGENVLHGVSLELLQGRLTALVGRSGAGKTTLVNLMAALYAPTSGTILIDGKKGGKEIHVALKDIDVTAWRTRVAFVPQDPFLFRATIRENIALGLPGATNAEIESAARMAGAHAFITARKGGYDAPLGDGGATLSGGERQRIALARALLHDPLLLVFDEPTSALDAKTEKDLVPVLREACRGRLAVIVTHRQLLADEADDIITLADGRLCGRRAGGPQSFS